MSDDALLIALELHRAEAADDPYAFRGGLQAYHLRTPGGALESATLDWSPDFMKRLAAVRRPGRDPALVQRLGVELQRFLKPTGWSEMESVIQAALRADRPVRVRFRASAAELYALPWELMTLGQTGRHLGELPGLSILYEWPETSTEPLWQRPPPEGGRVLFAWSAAGGRVPTEAHQQALQEGLAAGYLPFLPHRDTLANPTAAQIAEALQRARDEGDPVTALHLLAHGAASGSVYGVALDGPGGDPTVLTAAGLRRLLAPHADTLRLVVLAACDAGNAGAIGNQLGSLAQSLHQAGIAAVVAPRYPYSVAGSIRFAQVFYKTLLGRPASVEQALDQARQALAEEEEHLDWAALQLFSRAADGDDTRPWTIPPFRGLLPFRREHNRFFHGREAEVAELEGDLAALWTSGRPRFLVVAGASGTGKSSVVMAGWVPRLMRSEAPRWTWTRARPGHEPVAALANAVEAVVAAEVTPDAEGIEAALRAWRDAGASERLLLVVDQLEELFTHVHEDVARTDFVRLLWHLAGLPELELAVVSTLRVDFIGRCGEIVVDPEDGLRLDKLAYDEAHRVFVAQMGAGQLRAAIEEPARLVGLRLEPGLAARIVDEVQGEPGALPLMQYCLKLLWEQREGRTLLQSAYDGLGGVSGALQRHADAIVEQASELQRNQTRRLLVRLVGTGEDGAQDTRRRVPIPKLRPPDQDAAAAFDGVVDELVGARLLVRDEGASDTVPTTIEVAHEALIRRWDRLKLWLAEDREKLGQLATVEAWTTEWRAHGTLLDDTRLGYAVQVSSRYPGDLSIEALALIRESQAAAEARQRQEIERRQELERLLDAAQRERDRAEAEERRAQAAATRARRLALLAGGAFLVAAGLGVWAWQLQGEASLAAAEARAERDRAQDTVRMVAERRAEGDPTLQALLLREIGEPRTATGWVARTLAVLSVPVTEHLLQGLDHRVSAAVWHADSAGLTAIGDDGLARAWQLDGSREGAVRASHPQWLNVLAASPRGQRFAAGAQNGELLIWSEDTTSPPAPLPAHAAPLTHLAWHSSGERLASGARDGWVRVWRPGRAQAERSLKVGAIVSGLGWVGDTLVAALEDGRVLAWGAEDTPRTLSTHDGAVNALAIAGNTVVTGGDDASVRAVDLATGDVRVLAVDGEASTRGVTAVAMHADGRVLAATRAKQVLTWAPGATSPELLGEHEGWVWSLDLSPDGAWGLSGGAEGVAKLWALAEGGQDQVLRGHADDVRHVSFSPDGLRAATTDDAGGVRVWQVPPPRMARAWTHARQVSGLASLPAPDLALLSDLDGRLLRIGRDGVAEELGAHQPWINGMSASADGTLVVTAGADGEGRVWHLDTGEQVALIGHSRPLLAAALSPDGQRVATASVDGTARLWGIDGSPGPVLQGHEGWVVQVAWSPDGQALASVGADGAVHLWSAEGASTGTLALGLGRLEAVAFSVDGRQVMVGAAGGQVATLPVDGGAPARVLGEHEGGVRAVRMHPSQQAVLSGGEDGEVRLWPLDEALPVVVLVQHEAPVTALDLSQGGATLVSANRGGALREVRTDAQLVELQAQLEAVTQVCLSAAQREEWLGETAERAAQRAADCAGGR
ncbi:MAG: CHAT domain-containing protein [Alphaproteobacteria bacterium]|nr:CHAT domain-containing protein [Alphaproteobacteria bacterium]